MIPEFVQQLKETVEAGVNKVHTASPGQIVSFDPGTCQAVVSPSMKFKKPDGSSIDYPNVSGVPVYFQQGNSQKASSAFPVKPGDGCLLIFAEQSLDYWMYGRETDTDLKFDLTNCIVLVGLFVQPTKAVQRAQDEDAFVTIVGSTEVAITEEHVDIIGDIDVLGDVCITGNVTVNGNIRVNGGDVTADGVSLKRHVHGGVESGGSTTSAPVA